LDEFELVLDERDELGVGPVWNPDEQALYWVDIEGCRFHRLEIATGAHQVFSLGERIGVLRFCRAGGLVLATQHGFSRFDLTNRRLERIGDPEADKPHTRFNDGAVDQAGRFWAGTLGGHFDNALYRLDPDGAIRRMDVGFDISNGIGWSLDNRTMYLVDSTPGRVYAYDFDLARGEIANRRVLVDRSNEPGVPDGLAVDAQGFIWVAIWGGARLERYDPDGRLAGQLPVPVRFPTSMAFAGPDLADLYITSARTEIPPAERDSHPLDGGLLCWRGAGKGRLEPLFG
jgi:sugar lactone lactonase YvrE